MYDEGNVKKYRTSNSKSQRTLPRNDQPGYVVPIVGIVLLISAFLLLFAQTRTLERRSTAILAVNAAKANIIQTSGGSALGSSLQSMKDAAQREAYNVFARADEAGPVCVTMYSNKANKNFGPLTPETSAFFDGSTPPDKAPVTCPSGFAPTANIQASLARLVQPASAPRYVAAITAVIRVDGQNIGGIRTLSLGQSASLPLVEQPIVNGAGVVQACAAGYGLACKTGALVSGPIITPNYIATPPQVLQVTPNFAVTPYQTPITGVIPNYGSGGKSARESSNRVPDGRFPSNY